MDLLLEIQGDNLSHLDLSATQITSFNTAEKTLANLRELRLEFCTKLRDISIGLTSPLDSLHLTGSHGGMVTIKF